MTKHLPHSEQAILDIRKIEGYCLNPSHPSVAVIRPERVIGRNIQWFFTRCFDRP
jgi:hypothetical protein